MGLRRLGGRRCRTHGVEDDDDTDRVFAGTSRWAPRSHSPSVLPALVQDPD